MEKTYQMLVVDDNAEILTSLKSYFTKKGFSVKAAVSGLDALKLIDATQEDFDVIVTDLVMPDISGVAVTTVIKKRNPDMPVVAITGFGEQPEALAREAHADVVLEKPFKLDELEKIIHKLLAK